MLAIFALVFLVLFLKKNGTFAQTNIPFTEEKKPTVESVSNTLDQITVPASEEQLNSLQSVLLEANDLNTQNLNNVSAQNDISKQLEAEQKAKQRADINNALEASR